MVVAGVAGVSYPLLEQPTSVIPHQDAHWLTALRQFLADTNASLHIAGLSAKLPQPLREQDVCIMEATLELPNLSIS
jgi:hypothetical protein